VKKERKSNEKFVCEQCRYEIGENDDYCQNCGTNFSDSIQCRVHKDNTAEGICLICLDPYCEKCGIYVSGIFLCEQHSDYEIYEGMARVHGSSDSVEIDYLFSALQQENLHPFIYSRKASPLSLGGSDYSLFRASGDFMGNIINEIKIMLPLNEVLQGEKLLIKLTG
jgi:hypothetical protein